MLSVATGLVIWAHKRREPSVPWLYYLPVALVMLSFVQYTDALWGFQMAWYLVMLMLALTIFLLDSPYLNWFMTGGAIAAAVIGSLSSLQGLLIWPIGLFLLLIRSRQRPMVVAWIASGITTGVLYFYDFNFGANVSNHSFAWVIFHPRATVEFFFLTVGNVVGVQRAYTPNTHDYVVLVYGIMVVALAIWVVLSYGLRHEDSSGSPVGVALVCFGLLFAVIATEGRVLPGWGLSAGLRYSTFDLLILTGAYLTVIAPLSVGQHLRRASGPSSTSRPPWTRVVGILVLVTIAVQIGFGTYNGIVGARMMHQSEMLASGYTVNIDQIPASITNSAYIPGFLPDLAYVRRQAQVARTHHLSLFGTAQVATYTREGLPGTVLSTTVTSPKEGETVRGIARLSALSTARPGSPVTKVEFQMTDGERHTFIEVASPSLFRWVGSFNTLTVPNGWYSVRSIAFDSHGRSAISASSQFRVQNS